MGIENLIQDVRLEQSRFLHSAQYKELEDRVASLKAILELKETKGWQLLTDRLVQNIESLRNDMLFADEPADPIQAKTWRAERRACAKAMMLITDHVEAMVQDGKAALATLEGRVLIPPEYPGE